MNILPTITAFALLFALCSYALLHQCISVKHECLKVRGAHRIERALFSALDRNHYRLQKTPPKPKEKSSKEISPDSSIKYLSPRLLFNKTPLTKLNLAPLITKESTPQQALLRSTALKLLQELYQYTPLYQKEMEKQLLSSILTALEEHPQIETLEESFAYLEQERTLFYQLFLGTHAYTICSNIGIPPLSDFFTFDKTRKAVHIAHASKPVLEALFDIKITSSILCLEEEKWGKEHCFEPVTKTELSELLLHGQKNLSDFESLLNFSTSHVKRDKLILLDPLSRIQKKRVNH